ncbi:hypothetical protein QBC37DRAFT_398556 [Rhypophila decipiens]|uniref:ABM domain-containing protein n=1 Tax=Rhypophila decipiens TaxID=261697 RepID=A0AAN6YA26_9PEZI|nr:hypothetical protein QBC37DRAFT_398556 [Rhypophila decipiens]
MAINYDAPNHLKIMFTGWCGGLREMCMIEVQWSGIRSGIRMGVVHEHEALPRTVRRDNKAHTDDTDHWKSLFDILANAPGCKSVACSRIAEVPETAIFAIIWRAQTDVDTFSTSPAYDSFLAALGSPAPPVQTVKFTAHGAVHPFNLQSWLFFFTITLPHPITDAQREIYARMRGPAYPWYHAGMDPAMKAALMTMPAPSRARMCNMGGRWRHGRRMVALGGRCKMGCFIAIGLAARPNRNGGRGFLEWSRIGRRS